MIFDYICPFDGAPLSEGEPALVEDINAKIASNSQKTVLGRGIIDIVPTLLVHPNRTRAYPIRERVPLLKVEEAFAIGPSDSDYGCIQKSIQEMSKMMHELDWWYSKHYQGKRTARPTAKYVSYAFFDFFGKDKDFYTDKKLLDVGCGPAGTLGWADNARCRVGLDPLAYSYRQLGTACQLMDYVSADAERIPFPDSYFDVISCFNALDHVDNPARVISEIQRVLAPGGTFLLITDIHEEPTPCEPVVFDWDVIQRFNLLQVEKEIHLEKQGDGVYDSLRQGKVFDHDNPSKRYGILTALMHKPSPDQPDRDVSNLINWATVSSEAELRKALLSFSPLYKEIFLRWSECLLKLRSETASEQSIQQNFNEFILQIHTERFGAFSNELVQYDALVSFFLAHGYKLNKLATQFIQSYITAMTNTDASELDNTSTGMARFFDQFISQ